MNGTFKYKYLFFIIANIAFVTVGFIYENVWIATVGTLIFWVLCFCWSISKIRNRMAFFLFLVCFLLFLLGQYITFLFNDGSVKFDEATNLFILELLVVSLICLWIGHKLYEGKNKNQNKDIEIRQIKWVLSMRKISSLSFWITAPLYFANIMNRVTFVREYSYLESYTLYTGSNTILSYGQIICQTSFFIYLATMPSKKRSKYLIIAYLIINCLSLNAGGRATAVSSILLIAFYFMYREYNREEGEEQWIKKNYIVIGIIAFPFLIIFLSFWGYYRMGDFSSLQKMNLQDHIWNFISASGSSSDIIGYTKQFEDYLPETNMNYSFGYLINFIRSTPLFGGISYQQNTVEMALNGNSLGQTLSYFVMPYTYLNGGGLGSCYIAENWVDFGLLGVSLFNIFLGYILGWLSNFGKRNVFQVMICLMVMKNIFILPRETFLYVIRDFTSIIFLLTCIGVAIVAKAISR